MSASGSPHLRERKRSWSIRNPRVPPYVGHRGWLGVRLDVDLDWDEIAGIVEDAYRQIAPKTLIRTLDKSG